MFHRGSYRCGKCDTCFNSSGNRLKLKSLVSSDGMSDKEYPYSAIFILGNKVLEGCAEKK
ncbi:hypothetical protein FD723_41445 (plasmid) [Nostoc sp. C052]|uniref:hypothetical protein n=1 Tax=Nostoc sp. C052 TaxID=2576902 RepID=UPI0015C37177|nr:hypothetical protein [Nostoc sp. C052]QLE46647.1 hypothetical protein FD723_41445 [Nostoc sp. C052]